MIIYEEDLARVSKKSFERGYEKGKTKGIIIGFISALAMIILTRVVEVILRAI